MTTKVIEIEYAGGTTLVLAQMGVVFVDISISLVDNPPIWSFQEQFNRGNYPTIEALISHMMSRVASNAGAGFSWQLPNGYGGIENQPQVRINSGQDFEMENLDLSIKTWFVNTDIPSADWSQKAYNNWAMTGGLP